ncbi:endochitinase [Leptodontidium sp. MPI-SDFR-AT-0119]|nr:endochitinase [Leptodontidium sp. MPI-SDFR-AT-0119]
MKKKNRYLKVLLSIGGSSYLANFAAPALTVSGRTAFALTAVTLVKNLGLDGLDIDWEFPVDHVEAGNINLMAWDYAANLFRSTSDSAVTPFDTQTAIKYYLSQNVSLDKLVLGIPIYSRSFGAINSLGKPFNGVGKGTWEAGIYDYKDLLLRGAVENYDNASGASYSYDTTTRELISYDTIIAGKQKATWIQQMKLGGIM